MQYSICFELVIKFCSFVGSLCTFQSDLVLLDYVPWIKYQMTKKRIDTMNEICYHRRNSFAIKICMHVANIHELYYWINTPLDFLEKYNTIGFNGNHLESTSWDFIVCCYGISNGTQTLFYISLYYRVILL